MNSVILVSIIIPTYNRLEYFKKALDSALRQSYRSIEVIVTDDSTNNEIEEYLETVYDTRIKYLKNKYRLGIALNIRNGISNSSGQYFSFLNDDDFWSEFYIEKLIEAVNTDDNIGCVFCDHWVVNSTGEVLYDVTNRNTIVYKRDNLHTGIIPDKDRKDLFINFTVPVAMACMIKKDIINISEYPKEVGGAYDRWMLLLCLSESKQKFFYINERLTNYRLHELNASKTQSIDVVRSVIYILEKSKSKVIFNIDQKRSINNEIRVFIRSLIKKGSPTFLFYIIIYLKSFFR